MQLCVNCICIVFLNLHPEYIQAIKIKINERQINCACMNKRLCIYSLCTCMCASVSFQVGAFGIDFIAAIEVTSMNSTLLQWIWRLYLSTYNHWVCVSPVKDKKMSVWSAPLVLTTRGQTYYIQSTPKQIMTLFFVLSYLSILSIYDLSSTLDFV